MDYYAIGQRIRKFRKAHGLSQEELAEALDIRTDEMLSDGEFASRSAAIEEIVRILDACTTQEIKVMEDILKATKIALSKYL